MDTWRSIPNAPDYEIREDGIIRQANTHRLVKIHIDHRGYIRASLRTIGHKSRTFHVARLLYGAFVGPIPQGMTINHKDGNPSNNALQNLEVLSVGDNTRHAWHVLHRHGPRGEINGFAKLKNTDIPLIRDMLAKGKTLQAIADHFGLKSCATIWHIAHNKTWKHIQ